MSGNGRPGSEVGPVTAVESASDQTETTIRTDTLELTVLRVPGSGLLTDSAWSLRGVWPGQEEAVVLASARTR